MRLAGFILFCAGAAAAWGQGTALDIPQALQIAEADNLDLRAARQQRAMALAGLKIAGQIPNPTISFSASRDVPHESVLWDQSIEIGGQRGKRLAVAREEQKATEIDLVVLSRQVRRRTRQAFYEALAAQSEVRQSKAALDLATRIRDIVQQRYEAGDVAQLEVTQADVEMERAAADYEEVVQSEKSASAQLSAVLARPLDQAWDLRARLEDVPKVAGLQTLSDQALTANAEVQRTAQEVEIEQRRLALAKAQRIPNLDIQAGTDLNAQPDYSVGLRGQMGMTLPLFYHGQGEVALSSARLGLLQLSLQAQKTNASAQVVAAYYDYVAKAHQAEQYGQKIVPQTERLENMAEESYRVGKSNLLTLLDVQRKLNETRKAYLDSLLAAQSSFALLEEVVGTPLN